MRRSILVPCVCVLAVVLGGQGVRAANGCDVIATGHETTPGNCRYTASGPGTFEVGSISGFRISASADGGLTWRTVVAKTGLHNQPHTAVAVQGGPLDTHAGELVDVAIAHATMDTPNGILRYQDGTIKASDG